MDEGLDKRYRDLLARQLSMNVETWRALQSHGVTEATPLRLDFSYAAPDQASAEALKRSLEEQTDYDVEVLSQGGIHRGRWVVAGSTQPTAVSPAILDQWVDWMVTAGLHQNCEFDGWGTEAPGRD
jgi:regulator of ribonuclease activity B